MRSSGVSPAMLFEHGPADPAPFGERIQACETAAEIRGCGADRCCGHQGIAGGAGFAAPVREIDLRGASRLAFRRAEQRTQVKALRHLEGLCLCDTLCDNCRALETRREREHEHTRQPSPPAMFARSSHLRPFVSKQVPSLASRSGAHDSESRFPMRQIFEKAGLRKGKYSERQVFGKASLRKGQQLFET